MKLNCECVGSIWRRRTLQCERLGHRAPRGPFLVGRPEEDSARALGSTTERLQVYKASVSPVLQSCGNGFSAWLGTVPRPRLAMSSRSSLHGCSTLVCLSKCLSTSPLPRRKQRRPCLPRTFLSYFVTLQPLLCPLSSLPRPARRCRCLASTPSLLFPLPHQHILPPPHKPHTSVRSR